MDLILARDSKGNFGIPVGRIIGISGEEACGKTTLTIMILKAVQKMGEGLKRFMDDYAHKTRLEDITFVVYNDAQTQKKLTNGLEIIFSLSLLTTDTFKNAVP